MAECTLTLDNNDIGVLALARLYDCCFQLTAAELRRDCV